MQYANGQTVRAGDLVWWNGGACTGYVQAAADSASECRAMGVDCPSIFIANRHPFDASQWCGVAHAITDFVAEGIEPLTDVDRVGLSAAYVRAVEQLGDEPHSHYRVDASIQSNRQVGWIFTFMQADTEVRKIEVLG
ncbi:MAG: hypothetical protein HYR88_02195 [Verrucomicrobia bacterium]|nr:hypothetical protein [Verrucomicrobiota bacterium]MBI3868766.1 hypothetical protein [Verrucomicrobiota bacterium]